MTWPGGFVSNYLMGGAGGIFWTLQWEKTPVHHDQVCFAPEHDLIMEKKLCVLHTLQERIQDFEGGAET